MSDRMPEDLPVIKRIDVGITRSKVIVFKHGVVGIPFRPVLFEGLKS
jgi:hypothetical protein